MDVVGVELGEILNQLASSLERNVRSVTVDHFAGLQLDASIELLRAISRQASWRHGSLQDALDAAEHAAEQIERLLGQLPAQDAPSAPPLATPDIEIADLIAARERLSRCIADVYRNAPGDAGRDDAISAAWWVIRRQHDA